MGLVVLAAVCVATLIVVMYLLLIWWLDRYEREPLWVVGLTFLWGALGGTILSCIINSLTGSVLILGVGESAGNVMTVVMVAPIVEEFMKAFVFVFLVGAGNQLDNKTDGLIYGAATGLGFACVENLYYYASTFDPSQPEAIFGVIFIRTMFTALVHCISSALLGMTIGYARHRAGMARWVIWPLLGYIMAVFNHGVWNGLATISGSFGSSSAELALLTLLFSMGLVVCVSVMMFALTQHSLNAEHKIIKRFLLEEASRGVLPREHAEIIPYWLKRRKSDWLSSKIPKEPYVKAATLLAFRHHQLEIARGERKKRYLEDIARLRKTVHDYHRHG